MPATAIAMPRLGMSMEEGTVIEWPVPLGGRVDKGATVLVIESEKNEADIEATASGFLRHVYIEPGELVPCKTLLGAITDSDDEPFDPAAFAADYLEKVGPILTPQGPAATPALIAAAPPRVASGAGRPGRRAIAPAARALARKLDVDLDAVPGSGPGGRVVKQDVEAWLAARERLVSVEDGICLELFRLGSGDPVLFLPGFGTDVSSFALQSQALTASYQVLALNPRGVGGSDAPELPAYTVERASADAAAVLDQPTHIIGASLGAATALELALGFPEKVRSLTLITPFVESSARLQAVAEAWARIAAEGSADTLARFLLPWLFSERFLADANARQRTLRGLIRSVSRIPATTLERARAGLDGWSGARTGDLSELTLPVLVLVAGADLLTTEGEALARLLPTAQTVVVAGAGHALSIEAGSAVTQALLEHLSRSG